MQRSNLIDEAHSIIVSARKLYAELRQGKVELDIVKQSVGVFNAGSRAISQAIQSEKHYKAKQQHKA